MITIQNEGRYPFLLDSTISFELKTGRPPISGEIERLEQGDSLLIKVGHDVKIVLRDDILAIRAVV
jgi:hypothetical protein